MEQKLQRIRRDPKAARAEITSAFQGALGEIGYSGITVELLMKRTGMTRSLFYHYFTSLDDVVVGMLEGLEVEMHAVLDRWLGGETGEDYREATRHHLIAMFTLFEKRKTAVSALMQAASVSQQVYEPFRQRVIEYYVAMTADFIRRQNALGRSSVADPDRLARALNLMNNAMFTDNFTRVQQDPPEVVGRVVAEVWNAAIYD